LVKKSLAFPLIIIATGLLAYHNSFSIPFLLDDNFFILDYPPIHRLWPLSGPLAGIRPVVTLSLAINYALGNAQPWGYHAVNLAIHLLAALTLFALVRRTLETDPLQQRFGAAAPQLALAIAVLWTAHPLQTQSVNYVIQRSELLAGLFYLLTLYSFMRSAETATGGSAADPGRWRAAAASGSRTTNPSWRAAAAILSCALGMASKSVMITAPAVVLLYDRVFLSSSYREIFQRRGGFYAALATTWGIQAALLLRAPIITEFSAGLQYRGFPPLQYISAQPRVLLHYLRLSVWPHPLVFDYHWPIPHTGAALPAAALIGGLLAGTFVGLRHRWGTGFLGAWFFLILAPTSLTPLADPISEHRMYLPLATVMAFLVLGSYHIFKVRQRGARFIRRGLAGALLLGLTLLMIGTTIRRNQDYRSEISLWSDVARKCPDNPRAYYSLGKVFSDQGNLESARACFAQALRLKPDDVQFEANLGTTLAKQRHWNEAVFHFKEALRRKPDYASAQNDWGVALAEQGLFEEAIPHFAEALRIEPDYADARSNMKLALRNAKNRNPPAR